MNVAANAQFLLLDSLNHAVYVGGNLSQYIGTRGRTRVSLASTIRKVFLQMRLKRWVDTSQRQKTTLNKNIFQAKMLQPKEAFAGSVWTRCNGTTKDFLQYVLDATASKQKTNRSASSAGKMLQFILIKAICAYNAT